LKQFRTSINDPDTIKSIDFDEKCILNPMVEELFVETSTQPFFAKKIWQRCNKG